jgi:hypothetical protein
MDRSRTRLMAKIPARNQRRAHSTSKARRMRAKRASVQAWRKRCLAFFKVKILLKVLGRKGLEPIAVIGCRVQEYVINKLADQHQKTVG